MSTQLGSIKQTEHANRVAENELSSTLSGLSASDFQELSTPYDSFGKSMANPKMDKALRSIEKDYTKVNDGTFDDQPELASEDSLDIGDLPVAIREQVKRENEAAKLAEEKEAEEQSAKAEQDKEPLTPEEEAKKREREKNGEKGSGQGGSALPSLNIGGLFKRNKLGNPLDSSNIQSKASVKPLSNAILSNNASVNAFAKDLRHKTAVHEFAMQRVNDELKDAAYNLDDLRESFDRVNGAIETGKEPPARDLGVVNEVLDNKPLMKAMRQQEAALNSLATSISPKHLESVKAMTDSGMVGNQAMENLHGSLTTAVSSGAKGSELASTKHAGKTNSPETGNLEKIDKLLEGLSEKLNIPLGDMFKSLTSAFTRK